MRSDRSAALTARPLPVVLALGAALTLAMTARAEVLLVDPADPLGFPQIQPAIDAALPFDIIVVRPLADPLAVYDPFIVTGKETAIIGLIELGPVRVAGAQIGDIPVGSTVNLRQLEFVAPPDTVGLTVESHDGWVRLENINSVGGSGALIGPAPGLVVKDSASVVVTYCSLTGGDALPGAGAMDGAPGMTSSSSHVTVRGGSATGGKGADSLELVPANGGVGGDGIVTASDSILISNVTVTGGSGGLAACTPRSCDCGLAGNGGDCIDMFTSILTVEVCTLVPGLSPEGPCGPTGSPGLPIVKVSGELQEIGGAPHDYWMSGPLETHFPAKFHFKGVENEAIIISAGFSPLHKFVFKYDGDLYSGDVNLLDFYFIRFLDATGVHDTEHPVPAPPPGLTSFIAYTQGFFVKDGNAHLGPLSTLLYIGHGP